MAQIKIDRHGLGDLTKLLERIHREVLKAQCERSGLEMKLSFLNKFRKGQKWRPWRAREEIGVAIGKGLEFQEVLLQVGT